jgi:hypothetical protein
MEDDKIFIIHEDKDKPIKLIFEDNTNSKIKHEIRLPNNKEIRDRIRCTLRIIKGFGKEILQHNNIALKWGRLEDINLKKLLIS